MLLPTLAVGIIATFAFFFFFKKPKAPLPPGPRKLPLVGNLFQVPAAQPWIKFLAWAQEYGPIFHFSIGSDQFVVLNTADAVEELFVNKGSVLSSRTAPYVAHEILSQGQRQVFMPYGPLYRQVRKTVHSTLACRPVEKFRHIQELESRVLVHDLMTYCGKTSQARAKVLSQKLKGSEPEVPEHHWFSLVCRFSTSVVLMPMYGKRIHKAFDNLFLRKLYKVIENAVHMAMPGTYLADTFKFMRKLPDFLSPWRKQARQKHEWELEFVGRMLDDIKQDAKRGINRPPCLIDSYLKDRAQNFQEEHPGIGFEDGWLKDITLAYLAANSVEAGSETTSIAIQSFILLVLNNPEVLRKAQQELDRVVGMDRMPSFEDEDRLPYVVACIKESLRCVPPVPMGIPHSCDEDTIYNGYLIPKGATVIGNVFALHMDPNRFPEPTKFNPDRFFRGDREVAWRSGPDKDRDHYIFGWGRRFCQGSFLAEASLFITLSRILWGFAIKAPVDPSSGRPIVPDASDYVNSFSSHPGFVLHPNAFDVLFEPRSKKHEEIMESMFDDAQNQWELLNTDRDVR